MGLLDDSIREHLELKRRRGADPTEVARQEQEAFGPPRRGDFEVAPAEAQSQDHDAYEHAIDEPASFAAEAPTALHVVEDLPPVQDEPPRPHGDPAHDLPPAVADPVHEEPPPAELEPESPSQETRAFDPHEVRAATAAAEPVPVSPPPAPHGDPAEDLPDAPEPSMPSPRADEEATEPDGDADVLEETPEFLQETPEHDRLWFEQRPPRDFDF